MPATPEPDLDGQSPRVTRHEMFLATGGTRVEFWVDGTGAAGRIVALSEDSVYVCEYSSKCKFRQAWRALKSDIPVDEVLGQSAMVIPYERMEKIESDLQYDDIEFFWRPDQKKKPKEEKLYCADATSRDEIITTLLDRLGTNWQREMHRYGRLRATWAPLTFMVLVISLWALMAANPEVKARFVLHGNWRERFVGMVFHLALHVFGSHWVIWLIIPGIFWLVVCLLKPPIMVSLRDRRWQ